MKFLICTCFFPPPFLQVSSNQSQLSSAPRSHLLPTPHASRYLCYFLHLILGALPPDTDDVFTTPAVQMFATMTSNPTGSLRLFGNLVQIFFTRLVPIDPLEFCVGLWRRGLTGATSKLRALEIADVAVQAVRARVQSICRRCSCIWQSAPCVGCACCTQYFLA